MMHITFSILTIKSPNSNKKEEAQIPYFFYPFIFIPLCSFPPPPSFLFLLHPSSSTRLPQICTASLCVLLARPPTGHRIFQCSGVILFFTSNFILFWSFEVSFCAPRSALYFSSIYFGFSIKQRSSNQPKCTQM